MTPQQRRVLAAAGVEVREGGAPDLLGIPVHLVDHPTDPDVVYVLDARAIELTPPTLLDPDDPAWKVSFSLRALLGITA